MSLRAVFAYQNLDSTADLNLRFEKVITKGVFFGGDIVANGTTNTVTVQAFRAATQDGMVAVDNATTELVVSGNQKSYLCLLAKYNAPNDPQLSWIIHTTATLAADPNRAYLIVFGSVDLSASSGPVFSNLISYADRDVVTPVGRNTYLGSYQDLPALQVAYPDTVPVKQKNNDIALVASGISGLPTWYRWNTTAAAFQPFAAYQNEIATFNDHVANSNIHVTAGQHAALAGTFGTPSAGNKFVTEGDTTRTLSTDERAAVTNAIGLDTGLSATNPLVADHTPVVGHILIQKVADGNNVVAINTSVFGDINAVLYVGRQGVDSNGKSSACQYFNIEDLFGDGLAPFIGGIESPVTITNIGWLNPVGATFNPATNASVDANGFLTLTPGQNLYLTLNVNIPISTQYNVRMNVKARIRDLVPNWHNPTSYPAIAAATAFRNGRQPYILANTGDFKSLRVCDPAKANVFISADQTGYPSYGNVMFSFYAGAVSDVNLKNRILVGCGETPTLAFLSPNISFYTGLVTGNANVVFKLDADNNSIYAARDFVVVPIASNAPELRTPLFRLNRATGTSQATVTANTKFGSNPSYAFLISDSNGLGLIPEYTISDPGGTVSYTNLTHIRSGSASLTGDRHFDLVLAASPDSDNDIEANTAGSTFVLHKTTSSAQTSVTYTVWANSNYGSSLKTVLGFSAYSGRSPVHALSIGPTGYFVATGVDTMAHSVKVAEPLLVNSTFTANSVSQFKGVIKSFSGLNSSAAPSYLMRVNNGSDFVNAGAFGPYNSSHLRLGTDTTYGVMVYAADNSGVLREAFVCGVSDAQLLYSAANQGTVRLGPNGYQLMWGKEDNAAPVSSHIVIEESNTATRDLMIGRRAAGSGAFNYATAIRIREGVVTLPYIADNAAMLRFGNADTLNIGIGSASLKLTNGTYSISVSPNSLVLGNNVSTNQSAVYFHTYGQEVMAETYWLIQVGVHPNDTLMLSGGTAGQRAFIPGVTDVMDFGSTAYRIRGVYSNIVNASTGVTAPTYYVGTVIVPLVDTVDIGSTTNPFKMVYSHRITTDAFVIDSVLAGGSDCIYPKVDGAGVLGKSGNMFGDVMSAAFHGGGFYRNNAGSVIGASAAPFAEASATLVNVNVVSPIGSAHTVGTSVTPFSVGYFNGVNTNVITPTGTNHSVGTLAAPFTTGFFHTVNYSNKITRGIRYEVPSAPATTMDNVLLTLDVGENSFDTYAFDFGPFTSGTRKFVAKESPDTNENTCMIRLPNAADFFTDNGVGVGTGREIKFVLKTRITGTLEHRIGFRVDTSGDNIISVKLAGSTVDSYKLQTIIFRAVANVEQSGNLANKPTPGWNCVSHTSVDLGDLRNPI